MDAIEVKLNEENHSHYVQVRTELKEFGKIEELGDGYINCYLDSIDTEKLTNWLDRQGIEWRLV